MQSAAVLAMSKAKDSFGPMIDALELRTSHIMKRLYYIIESMIANDGRLSVKTIDKHNRPFQELVRV